MLLELEPDDHTSGKITGKRRLERGELTIGRDPACDLVVSDDSRMVSKLHCRIVGDDRGFQVRDESSNGVTVSGREMARDENVRLADRDVIVFCGFAFTVAVTGVGEPDWSDPDERLKLGDEALSITSILADLAPRGRGASGILPGRLADDWAESATHRPGREDDRLSRAEVGWRGPPPLGLLGGLPADWNSEGSETGSRNEHVAATGTRMRAPRSVGPAPEIQSDKPAPTDDRALLDAFLQGYGAALEPTVDPELFMRQMGRSLRELGALQSRIAAQTRDFVSSEGADWARVSIDPLDPADGIAEAEAAHQRFLEALRDHLDELDRLAPASIEARMALSPSKSAQLPERLKLWAADVIEGFSAARKRSGEIVRSYAEAYGASGKTPRQRLAARFGEPEISALDDYAEAEKADR